MSLRASAMPRLSAAGLPALGWLITRTYGHAQAADDRRRAVGGAVVDDDDLELGRGNRLVTMDRMVAAMPAASL